MPEDWSSILKQDLQQLSEVVGVQPVKTEQIIPGERRDVAMLFLDLKGFTAMSETMDHEMVHKVIGGIMKPLSNIVKEHGGYVDKFEGDLIMALFGAKKTSDNDCIRAVSCGLKMFRVLADINKIFAAKGFSIGARCGISYGSVTVAPDASGHLTVMGDEVNLASRMESSAEVNTVQVTSVVQKECGDYFEWENLGEISVRGKKKPIQTYRPTGPGKIQTERWDRATRVSRSPMVGREKEMAKLQSCWDNLAEGHIAVGIKAEAGIGKSRLASEFVKSLGAVRILKGQTLSFAQPLNWLWITLLRDYFEIMPDDPKAKEKFDRVIEDNEDLKYTSPFLAELLSVPNDDPRLKFLDHEVKQRETLNALRDLVQHVGNQGRTIVIFEDLHWMDNSSKDALEFVLANCESKFPILFLFLYRPDSDVEIPKVSEEISLTNIDDDSCRSLIESMLGQSSTDVEDFLLKHSQGNPFFLEEFILDMIESGDMKEVNGTWQLSTDVAIIEIPTSMSGLINSRIDRLPTVQKEGLQHSAVIGMEFWMKLYCRLTERLEASGKAEELLIGLEKRDFIVGMKGVSDLKYVFKHILTRNTAYVTILKHNRLILHRHVAEELVELFPNDKAKYGEVAYHFEQAEDWENALDYYTNGGHFFKESFRYNEAASLFEKALSISELMFDLEHPEIVGSLHNLAVLYQYQALYSQAEQLFLRSLQIQEKAFGSQHLGVAESLIWLGLIYFQRGRFEKSSSILLRALQMRENILGQYHPDVAHSMNALAFHYLHTKVLNNNNKAFIKRSLEINEKVFGSQHPFYVRNLNNLAILKQTEGKFDEAEQLHIRAVEICEISPEAKHTDVENSLNKLADFYISQDLDDKAEPLMLRVLKSREEHLGMHHPEIASSLNNLASIYRSQGSYEKAEQLIKRALEIREKVYGSKHPFVSSTLNNLALNYKDQGSYDKAESILKRVLITDENILGLKHQFVAQTSINLARIHQCQGQYDKAELLFKRSIDIFSDAMPDHIDNAKAISYYADMLEEAGRPEEAKEQRVRAQVIRDKNKQEKQ